MSAPPHPARAACLPDAARALCDLVDVRVKRILDLAELALPADKFERFRTLVLDEFGHKGLRGELAARLKPDGMDRQGKGRNEAGREGGVP